jgi:hypothetical protein
MDGDHCPRCQAIAKPQHAEQAKVTLSTVTDAAIHQEEPRLTSAPSMEEPASLSIRLEEPKQSLESVWGFRALYALIGCLPVGMIGLLVIGVVLMLLPNPRNPREPGPRTISINNMNQIAIACHNYHDVHKAFPSPAMTSASDGKEHVVALSWRVSILPFIEQGQLHKAFDATVGWDHARNIALQERMPSTYQCPYRQKVELDRMTHFQCFTGPGTLYPDNAPRTIKDIADGTERTILFAEAAAPVVWSRPADMAIRPDQELPLPADRFLAAMADATVRFIQRDKIDDAILRQLINPNDNKPDAGWDP